MDCLSELRLRTCWLALMAIDNMMKDRHVLNLQTCALC